MGVDELVTALQAQQGIVSVVGAGGKKSTIFRLAEGIDRPVVTATVRIPPFEEHVGDLVVTRDALAAIDAAGEDDWPLGLVPDTENEDRYLGYGLEIVADMAVHEAVDTVLVKADGARMRKFKAPGPREPQLPPSSTVVVPVVSAHAIGEPLSDELVHRVEQVSAITGLSPGQVMAPEAIAEVLVHPEGGYKRVPEEATVIPLINMVDDDGLQRQSQEVARAVLANSDAPRVVLTRLTDDDPVVEVVE